MSDPTPSFFSRLFSNEIARKGVAGAVGAVIVAAVSEMLWPST